MSDYDHTAYVPFAQHAHREDRPYDSEVIGRRMSNLQWAATHWGTSFAWVPTLVDADNAYGDYPNAERPKIAWHPTPYSARFACWALVPYVFHPGIKSIEMPIWHRISRFDIDDSGANPAGAIAATVVARPVAVAIKLENGDPFVSSEFDAELEGSAPNTKSRWQQESITLNFDEASTKGMVAPAFGFISLEMASADNNYKLHTGDVSINYDSPADRAPFDSTEAVNSGGSTGFVKEWPTGGSGNASEAHTLRADPNSVSGVDDILFNEHPGFEFSSGSSIELEVYRAPYFQWRSVGFKEEYYPIDFDNRDRASLVPPSSRTPRAHSKQARQVWSRGECVGIWATRNRVGVTDAGWSNFIDDVIQPRKQPPNLLMYVVFVHTLTLTAGSTYRADSWGKIQQDSPTLDMDMRFRVTEAAAGTVLDSETDTRNVTAYAESIEGPNVLRNKGPLDRLQVEPIRGDNERDFGGEMLQYWDRRRIWLDLDGAGYDFRLPHQVELDLTVSDGPNLPTGSPLGSAPVGNVRSTLYGASCWAQP